MVTEPSFRQDNASICAVLLFIIGLFSSTQINLGGKLGISEFLMVAVAPFLFLKNYSLIKRDKVLYFFIFVILWFMGAVIADVVNKTYINFAMRGIAVPVTVFANTLCIYLLLRKNHESLKWLLLGIALSEVISIFIFQRGRSGDIAAAYGSAAGAQGVINYKLFWVVMATTWLGLPIKGWYKKTPKLYTVFALVFLCSFALLMGARSLFLALLCSFVLLIPAGKSRATLIYFKKHYLALIISLIIAGGVANFLYKQAVTSGYLNEGEEKKFERQTEFGSNIIKLLMAGRSEFFVALSAAMDSPLIGKGSVAIDDKGYIVDFLYNYGNQTDYINMIKRRASEGVAIIPSHSHVVCYWMWHGIFALLFWASVFVLSLKTLFLRLHICPEYYGYCAMSLPIFLWDYFFSPFDHRVIESTLFAALLLISKMTQDYKVGCYNY